MEKIKELKNELAFSDKACYKLIYRYNLHISGYNFRIVKNCPEIRWKFPCQETIIVPDGSIIEERPITVEHWGAWKPGRDTEILKKAYEGEWKDDGRMQFYYIRDLCYHHKYEEAVELFRKHLYNVPWYTKFGAYYFYAESCFKTERYLKAVDLCKKAIKERPIFSDFYCLLGNYYMGCKKYPEAKDCFEKALGNEYPQSTSEVFMIKDNYGSEPSSKLKELEQLISK